MKIFFFPIIPLCFSLKVFSQEGLPDSLFYIQTVENVNSCYKASAGAGLVLYNGAQYSSFVPRTKGHPYFIADSLFDGTILYAGVLYRDVKIKYDLAESKVAMYNFTENFLFCPGEEKVKYFTIGDHFFENVDAVTGEESMPVHGYYERLFKGVNVSAYARREKKLFQPFRAEDTLPFYDEYKSWYISRSGTFYRVSGKRSLLKILQDKKQEIRSFISDSGIKEIDDESLNRIAVYYESIKTVK